MNTWKRTLAQVAALVIAAGALVAASPQPAAAEGVAVSSHGRLSPCGLVSVIRGAGFTGRDVRIAWAVAMRESNGRPALITNSDYGLFQFNRPSWGRSSWWNTQRLLTASYNAGVARRMVSQRGWRPWGLNRSGTAVYAADYRGVWSEWQIQNWIWKPYRYWHARYPSC